MLQRGRKNNIKVAERTIQYSPKDPLCPRGPFNFKKSKYPLFPFMLPHDGQGSHVTSWRPCRHLASWIRCVPIEQY